jgi:EAL domain-containing protein (putative c-di-GMP-specific phosphodiesterase class I)
MSDRNELLLDDMIHKGLLYHVFQRIYALGNWRVLGYEILLRSVCTPTSESLFRLAMEQNKLYDLDCSSIYHAFISTKLLNIRLFVNVFPSTLIHPSFPDFLEKLDRVRFSTQTIVFEINGAKLEGEGSLLRTAVQLLKDKGYGISLEHFGCGKTLVKLISELVPDFVKLGRHFTVGLSTSDQKQNEVRMVLDLCERKNIKLILKGIEEATDLAIAKALGVYGGQGYLLDKPMPLRRLFQ